MQVKLGILPSSGLTINSYGCGINFHTTEPILQTHNIYISTIWVIDQETVYKTYIRIQSKLKLH